MRVIVPAAAGIIFLALTIATAFVAAVFDHQQVLGAPLFAAGSWAIYPPWDLIGWINRWGEHYPRPFAAAYAIVAAGGACALALTLVLRRPGALQPFGQDAWADFEDVRRAGLFGAAGAVLGSFEGEMLVHEGEGHQVLIGASRSGKGRGHVVPTLLSWPGSALVFDVKGELDRGDPRLGFPGTSGLRAQLGPVLRFAPTQTQSNAFNPLFEVRRGVNEIRDVQNVVEALVTPHGEPRGAELFWSNKGKDIITGVVVHVLYSEATSRKTLAVVREKLRDLDRTAEDMRLTLHRLSPKTNQPEVHPEALHAAHSYLGCEERLRSGIKATAEAFFGVFADPLVAEKTASSDFRIGDLMCADRPVTLYLQPPPSDAARLMPVMRLFINLAARALMEDQAYDGEGREKKHRLVMLLDGAYDNATRYGDRRILLSWTRLILPNGWSINLQEMSATDPAGAPGLMDRTNNHLARLGVAIGLPSVISVIANESEDDGEDNRSLTQSVGDAAAQQAAQTGSRIVDRELIVRPSLTVRPGASVRLIVERDIQLRPYQ